MTNTPQIVVDDQNLCGEGPIWDIRNKRLIWEDLASSLVFAYDLRTRQRTILSTTTRTA